MQVVSCFPSPRRAACLSLIFSVHRKDSLCQPSPSPNGAIPHLCLRTTRLDIVCERARASGARITMEPKDAVLHSTNGVGPKAIRLCFFDGPNGESIELLQNAP